MSASTDIDPALSRAREVPRSAEQKARQHSWNPKLYPRCTKIIQKCDHLLGICYKKILLHRDLVTTDILKEVGYVFFYLVSSLAQSLSYPLIFIRLLVKNFGTSIHR
jgi:hypothetical protein